MVTHHEIVLAIRQLQTIISQNLLQQRGVAAERRVDDDGLALQLLYSSNGGNRSDHQTRALVQLTENSDILLLVEAVIERVVYSRNEYIELAPQDRVEGGGAVGYLGVHDIEAILSKKT